MKKHLASDNPLNCHAAVDSMFQESLFFVPDPPTVTLSIEPRSVLEGDRVTFTCQAHANPPIMGYRSASASFLCNTSDAPEPIIIHTHGRFPFKPTLFESRSWFLMSAINFLASRQSNSACNCWEAFLPSETWKFCFWNEDKISQGISELELCCFCLFRKFVSVFVNVACKLLSWCQTSVCLRERQVG